MRGLFIFMAICLLCVPASAKSLRFNCNFTTYSSPDGLQNVTKDFRLEFTLDTTTGQAMFVGNNGLAEVRPIIGSEGVTFLEQLETGVVQSTTVSKVGQAVHSRHTIIDAELVPSQYYGECN